MRRADWLFQIIQLLRRSSSPRTAAAIAGELEVSIRTIYRDIADLMAQRVPIEGEAGIGYRLDPSFDMPPLMLSGTEVEATVLGAQWVVGHGDPSQASAAREVLARIAAVVPVHLRPFIAEPSTGIRTRLDALIDAIEPGILRDAIRRHVKLRLVYRAPDGMDTSRIVWPVVLGYSDSNRMLIAWCETRGGFRHFRTDRMVTVEPLDERVAEPAASLLGRWEGAVSLTRTALSTMQIGL